MCIKWRGEDRDGQIDEEKRTKRKGARARGEGERQLEKIYPRAVKGKDIGVPRLAADEMDAAFDADSLEGVRTDREGSSSPVHRRSRCSRRPYGRPRGAEPPRWGAGGVVAGRGEAGGGRGCEADSSPRVGSARRPMRATGFPAIVWKARTAGSSSMRSARPRDLSREDVCVSQHSIFSILSPCFFQIFWEFVSEELF